MKEYQYLIGKIIAAVAIIVAAIIIAQAIGGAGESIRSGNYSCRNHYSAGYWWSWRKYPQWLVSIRGCASVTFDLLN